MAVKFSNALQTWNDDAEATVGMTVSEVLKEYGVNDSLGLVGGETVQVSLNGGAFGPSSLNATVTSGSEFRFSRAAGTKG